MLEQGSAFNLANRHLNLTGANVEVLKEADLVLAVGVKDIEAALKRPVPEAGSVPSGQPRVSAGYGRRYESLIPAGAQLMRIGLEDYGVKSWASSYGRLCPTAFPILGDGVQVRELRRLCADAMDGGCSGVEARSVRARQLHTAMYDRIQQDLKARWWGQKPTSTARLAAEIWEAIKGEDWVLVHGS